MKTLLLVAHGSRRDAANDEIRALTERLRVAARFGLTECAFLEFASPTIAEGAAQLVNAGASQIIVLPYFLADGNHVIADLPAHIARIQQQHPSIDITLAPHLGAADAMPQWIDQHLTATRADA